MAPDIIQIGFSDSLGMFEPIFIDSGFFRFRIPPSYPQNFSGISIKIWAPERAPQGPLRGPYFLFWLTIVAAMPSSGDLALRKTKLFFTRDVISS